MAGPRRPSTGLTVRRNTRCPPPVLPRQICPASQLVALPTPASALPRPNTELLRIFNRTPTNLSAAAREVPGAARGSRGEARRWCRRGSARGRRGRTTGPPAIFGAVEALTPHLRQAIQCGGQDFPNKKGSGLRVAQPRKLPGGRTRGPLGPSCAPSTPPAAPKTEGRLGVAASVRPNKMLERVLVLFGERPLWGPAFPTGPCDGAGGSRRAINRRHASTPAPLPPSPPLNA